MKLWEFIKNRIFKSVIFIVILLELILIFILYKIGFRLTYGPELEASWDAIGAMGQWAGVAVGLLIPIAAVYLQNRLEMNKKEIGESNIALLEEFESFKNEHEDKLKQLSHYFDSDGNFTTNLESLDGLKKEEPSREELKKKAHKFVNVSMITNTKRVAEHLNISQDEAFDILEELLRDDGLISAGGIVGIDNMKSLVWTKKR